MQSALQTAAHDGSNVRNWKVYVCNRCGGLVSAWAYKTDPNSTVKDWFPKAREADEDIPERPRIYLQQAYESLHAPAGAVMLAASAVDSMLKHKDYTKGSLYSRIQQAVKDHVITQDIADWAHDVRLDANDQRHADEAAVMPTASDAKRVVDFASALGEILFVLPGRVQRGLGKSNTEK